ncbi:hypothetical protein D3C84_583850 [compost metagenome]
MQVAAFQQQFAQADRGVVAVTEKGVLDYDGGLAAGLEQLDKVLEEQKGGFPGLDWEVLLHLFAFLAAEWRVGQHDVVTVLVLNIRQVLGQGIGVDDIRRFDAMQNHIHDGDHVGQALFLLAVEGVLLQGFPLAGA